MVRVEPVPTHTTLVVVGKHPLKTFNISLLDFLSELILVLLLNVELVCIVSSLPTFGSKLDSVNKGIHSLLVLIFHHSLDHFLNLLCS